LPGVGLSKEILGGTKGREKFYVRGEKEPDWGKIPGGHTASTRVGREMFERPSRLTGPDPETRALRG